MILIFVFMFITSGVVKSLYFRDYQRDFVYSVAMALDVDVASFSERDFGKGASAYNLSKNLIKDCPDLALSIQANPFETLNRVLRTPDFYDKFVSTRKDFRLNWFGEKLAMETLLYRQKAFEELEKAQQKNILKLNRNILETLYPQDCPKGRGLKNDEDNTATHNFRERNILQVDLKEGNDIVFESDLQLQKITFSEQILFPKDDYLLKTSGKEILMKVGTEIKRNTAYISEIQILGHADPDKPKKHESNLHLAAKRAIEVFRFFQDEVGIDPNQHLLSATSYGEFKPICRGEENNQSFSDQLLDECNSTEELKSKNRRIELLIRYSLDKPSKKREQNL